MAYSVAYAVVHHDPPDVFIAEDIDVLQRRLALELVARSPGHRIAAGTRDRLQQALLDERWGDAVYEWITLTGIAVDVFTHTLVFTAADLPADLIGAQLQFTPLFRDSHG